MITSFELDVFSGAPAAFYKEEPVRLAPWKRSPMEMWINALPVPTNTEPAASMAAGSVPPLLPPSRPPSASAALTKQGRWHVLLGSRLSQRATAVLMPMMQYKAAVHVPHQQQT